MKFCGYCGASITDSALSFCPECGKKLVSASKQKSGDTAKTQKPVRRTSILQKAKKPVPEAEDIEVAPAMADGYDGYYEDVLTADDGGDSERMDPELLKRVLLVAVGAVLLIGISTLIILFL